MDGNFRDQQCAFMIRWLNSTLLDDFTAATSVATLPTSQPKLEQEVTENVVWCCCEAICGLGACLSSLLDLPGRVGCDGDKSASQWNHPAAPCFLCVSLHMGMATKRNPGPLVPWSYHKNSWETDVHPVTRNFHSHWLNPVWQWLKNRYPNNLDQPCRSIGTPDSTHATRGPTQQRAAAVIGTERGAAPCTPRARLNGAAALCAAAATWAGEVLCCPMWVSADMFNLHKIVIVGERYDQHLDFGIDTIVEQTHGSRFWWTDRIGHVQSMILTQHVVFLF